MAKFSELAAWLGLEPPFEDPEISRTSSLEDASQDTVVFATDLRTYARAVESSAGAILAPVSLKPAAPHDPRVLWVRDPRYAFALVASRLAPPPTETGIHSSAVVSSGATIGLRTSVGANSVVESGAVIGADCRILANVTVHGGTTVGDRAVLQSGAVLGSTGFGYVRNPETGAYLLFPQQGTLILEDDVEIGANTTIDRGALGETRIRSGAKIDNLVHIAHNCDIGRNVIIAAQTGISGSTVIGNNAIVGGQVGIGDHATVGPGVVLGSGSGVLPGKKLRGPGEVFWGIPAQPLKSYLRDLAKLRRE